MDKVVQQFFYYIHFTNFVTIIEYHSRVGYNLRQEQREKGEGGKRRRKSEKGKEREEGEEWEEEEEEGEGSRGGGVKKENKNRSDPTTLSRLLTGNDNHRHAMGPSTHVLRSNRRVNIGSRGEWGPGVRRGDYR